VHLLEKDIFFSYSPQWLFLELIKHSEIRLCCGFAERLHAQMLFRENLQEASTKGFQITITLPVKWTWGDSLFLVI